MEITKLIIISLFSIVASILLLISFIKVYNSHTNRIRSRNGIEFQGYININGITQWICIRGENRDNPFILYLHGGPGSPESAMASKKYQKRIEESFVMVHWEQRGTGKSYSEKIGRQTLTLTHFIEDLIELSEYLIKTYGKKKIFLIGHSFGSMIGLEAISKRPDLYYAYIGTGQFVNTIDQENLSRQFVLDLAKKEGNKKAIQELSSINVAPYKNTKHDIFLERKYLMKSSGWVGKNYSIGKLIIDALVCPYYSFGDYIKAYKGAMYSLNQTLNENLWKIAFDKSNRSFEIPVFFISGTNDFNTPTALVKKYFSTIKAPLKEMILFEDCGHLVNFEDPARFNDEVCRLFGGIPPPPISMLLT